MSNFAGIGQLPSVARMSLRPRPELDVPETRRSDECAVPVANDGEGQRVASAAPTQRGGNVVRPFFGALRNRAPLIEGGVFGCRPYQGIQMVLFERLEGDVAP